MYVATSMPCQRRGAEDESAAGVVSAGGGEVSTDGAVSSPRVAAGAVPRAEDFSFARLPLADFSLARDGTALSRRDGLAGVALGAAVDGAAVDDAAVAVTSVSRGVCLSGSRRITSTAAIANAIAAATTIQRES